MWQRNRVLTDLHLDYNDIGPEGAGALCAALNGNESCQSKPVQEQAMAGGFSDLQSNTTLTNMWLHGNDVGAEVQRQLAAALAQNIEMLPRKIAAAQRRLALAALGSPRLRRGTAVNVVRQLGHGQPQHCREATACVVLPAGLLQQIGVMPLLRYPLQGDVAERALLDKYSWAWRQTQQACAAVLPLAGSFFRRTRHAV